MEKKEEELLIFLFDELLPRHGMKLRQKQRELSLEMLRALQENRLALCEAEVGTGKTHTYILALTVHNLYARTKAPAVISTSTIALQKALTEEYIPQISGILLEHHIIDKPLSFVVRKGKKHFVCDSRLKTYEASIRNLNKEGDAGLLMELAQLLEGDCRPLDLDDTALTPYVKGRINVLHCNDSCPYAALCRFMAFKKRCLAEHYDFQITNHNYILADLIGRRQGKKPLFPRYGAVVLDEAHKLVDAARQMYCIMIGELELESLLKLAGNSRPADTKCSEKQELLQRQLTQCKERLFQRLGGRLDANHTREGSRDGFTVGPVERGYIRSIITGLEQIPALCEENGRQKARARVLRKSCQELADKLNVFLNAGNYICWMEKGENGRLAMCAVPMELEKLLYQDIWSRPAAAIITSGTISVRGDFSHFKRVTGLQYAVSERIMETSKPSPFDYPDHGLLYIPERMPFPNIRDERYIQAIMEEIERLVYATHGHTLILFTSYWLMERVFFGLRERLSPYPLFLMGRGRLEVIRDFRKSGNGILFASDSAGEGIDLAGDILSSLIVVKLPFPVPDPVMEYQRQQYVSGELGEEEGFRLYKKEIIIPEMLIKLRQWFGRGIRRESDTAVFSILDSRAALRGRYRMDILNTLPHMPVTDRLEDVEEFILRKKAESYFIDGKIE